MGVRVNPFFIACLCVLLARPVEARCYEPQEAWAEQLIRIHSELMVITLACKYGSHGEPLAAAYGDFTREHKPLLQRAEARMQAYYREGTCGEIDSLDSLRTTLANDYGIRVAEVKANRFCQQYRDKVVRMRNLSTAQLDREVQLASMVNETYNPLCSSR
ncbi:MAG: hypothetical protein AB7S81_06675 [Bdellovibrionales bacterium]